MNGGWGPWSVFDSCTKTCGGGTKSRRRSCDNPAPQNGGRACVGAAIETVPCNTLQCPTSKQDNSGSADTNPQGKPRRSGLLDPRCTNWSVFVAPLNQSICLAYMQLNSWLLKFAPIDYSKKVRKEVRRKYKGKEGRKEGGRERREGEERGKERRTKGWMQKEQSMGEK